MSFRLAVYDYMGNDNIKTHDIDLNASDEGTMFIDIPSHSMTVIIKREHEGIVVDVYPLKIKDEPIATLCAFIEDAVDEEDAVNE